MQLTAGEKRQLHGSIEKLFHYLLPYVKLDTTVEVVFGGHCYEYRFDAPRVVNISPTLYTRIDGCHGAGNCCRVPFDLVYTEYDRSRIDRCEPKSAVEQFGVESAEIFSRNKDHLLNSLQEADVFIRNRDFEWKSKLYIKLNREVNKLSGTKSCPYLFTSVDRYYCGIHLFKPLHCWYPHMTVRVTDGGSGRNSVSIGRMQYGRNHQFGCPVIFREASASEEDMVLFNSEPKEDYFARQFESDIDKLKWTSESAVSLGFTNAVNFAVNIDREFKRKEAEIRSNLLSERSFPVQLWSR